MSTNNTKSGENSTKITKSLESDDDNTNELLSKNILVNLKAQIEKVNDSEIGKEYDKLLEKYREYKQEQKVDNSAHRRISKSSNDGKRSPPRKRNERSPGPSRRQSSSRRDTRRDTTPNKSTSKTREKSPLKSPVPKSSVVAVQNIKKDEKDSKKESSHKKDDKSRTKKDKDDSGKSDKDRKDERFVNVFLCNLVSLTNLFYSPGNLMYLPLLDILGRL